MSISFKRGSVRHEQEHESELHLGNNFSDNEEGPVEAEDKLEPINLIYVD